MVAEYHNEDYLIKNLAQLARHSVLPDADQKATKIAVALLDEYYTADNEAFAAARELSFRDGAMHKALEKLEGLENPTSEEAGYMTVLKEGLEVQAELLLGTELVVVAPDLSHWDFTCTPVVGEDTPFKFQGPGTKPLINAWPELRYAGILSNPAQPAPLPDPTEPSKYEAAFVLNPQRLKDRAEDVSAETGHSVDRTLKTVFVNAAQRVGIVITFGAKEGQFGADHWVEQANTAKRALALG